MCPKGYRQSGSATCAGSTGPMGHEVNEMRNSDRTRPRVYVRGLHILQNLEQAIRRTPHAQRPTIEDVSINHRRADVRMAQQLLQRPNVVPVLQQVSRETMSERVAADTLGQARGPDGGRHCALHRGLVKVKT